MDFLTDWLTNWLKELLISGIMGNLSGLFDTVNAQVGEIAPPQYRGQVVHLSDV